MTDISHSMGSDLTFGPTGDIATVSSADETQQRLLRRLLTNAGDYIFHLDYGAGLGAMVGQPVDARQIQGIVAGQVLREAAVSQDPAPTVTTQADSSGVVVTSITYADADGATQTLTLPG